MNQFEKYKILKLEESTDKSRIRLTNYSQKANKEPKFGFDRKIFKLYFLNVLIREGELAHPVQVELNRNCIWPTEFMN